MSARCQVGRNHLSNAANRGPVCPLPPLPDRCFCAVHMEEALRRVAQVPTEKRGDRPRRWTGGWMVSGTSRD